MYRRASTSASLDNKVWVCYSLYNSTTLIIWSGRSIVRVQKDRIGSGRIGSNHLAKRWIDSNRREHASDFAWTTSLVSFPLLIRSISTAWHASIRNHFPNLETYLIRYLAMNAIGNISFKVCWASPGAQDQSTSILLHLTIRQSINHLTDSSISECWWSQHCHC